jgi:histidinol dehydrogenase
MKIWRSEELPPDWFKRKQNEANKTELEKTVKTIIEDVKRRGNQALIEYTEKFDKTRLNYQTLAVTTNEIAEAYNSVREEQINALKIIKQRVEMLERQTSKDQHKKTTIIDGIAVQTVSQPLESVGCYVPGGRAIYPSTLVMTATPAKVAGVSRIVACSPPSDNGSINPLILVASDICGVNEIYKVGGVQAIAALAYGTETIKPVTKIVGPGSQYVTAAKIMVSQDVAIDMPAGPSEILVLADETADPNLIAADMISQAEHGEDSVAVLVTTSESVARKVLKRLQQIIENVERKEIVENALTQRGFIITCSDIDEAVELANIFSPEHLEIMIKNAKEIAKEFTSAGLILVGPFSPVALSDYGSGTNHVLPTGGFGRSCSGLSTSDFTRKVRIVESTKEGLSKVEKTIKVLTETEKLPNHYKAVELRFKE